MKKYFFVLILLVMANCVLQAQMGSLMVKRGDKGLYVDHKVVAKEGLYSIGRIYHVHPHHLAAYNDLDPDRGLNLGQNLRIPLTDTNFNQRSDDGLPVYHEVAAGDGLSAISRVYNRVPVERLRNWNNLRSDNINRGSKLIVGYLTMTGTPATDVVKQEPIRQQPEIRNVEETVVNSESEPEKQPEALAIVQQQEQPEEKPAVQKQVTEQVPPPVQKPAVSDDNSTDWEGAGFFKPYFAQQAKETPPGKNETVTSGVFKTTSGWQDGKYYVLIDNVPTGSIVRIINPENNKIVFAKVLGQMNGIRQNQGLGIRISNAAASALGVANEEKFVLQVNY